MSASAGFVCVSTGRWLEREKNPFGVQPLLSAPLQSRVQQGARPSQMVGVPPLLLTFGLLGHASCKRYRHVRKFQKLARCVEPGAAEFGKLERLGNAPRFCSQSVLIKEFPEDFIVTEIPLPGERCSRAGPQWDKLTAQALVASHDAKEAARVDHLLQLGVCAPELSCLRDILGQQSLTSILSVVAASRQGKPATVQLQGVLAEREQRKRVYDAIRQSFGAWVALETLQHGTNEPALSVSARLFGSSSGGRRSRATLVGDTFSVDGKFLHFDLTKRNLGTADAIETLASCLQRKQNQLSYLGQKDKRALTTQRICAHRVTKEELLRAVASKRMWPRKDGDGKSITISEASLRYSPERLWLGELWGNHFEVVLRRLSAETTGTHVVQAFQRVKHDGFLNYFGPQRFGLPPHYNHQVGKALLEGKWDDAVQLILTPAVGGVVSPMARTLKHKLAYQRRQTGTTDSRRALDALPRANLRLYTDAAASYIFNSVLNTLASQATSSERVGRLKGLQLPVPGPSAEYPSSIASLYVSEHQNLLQCGPEIWNEAPARSLFGNTRTDSVVRPAVVVPIDLQWDDLSVDSSPNAEAGDLSLRFSCALPASAYLTALLHQL